MRLLLDTPLILWWQLAPHRIDAGLRDLLMESGDAVFVSRASLWEVAIKASLGKLKLNLSVFCDQIVLDGFQWLDIRQSHLLAVAELPRFDDHKDPFDRLLVAQSLSEPLILLSSDPKLPRYGSTVRLV